MCRLTDSNPIEIVAIPFELSTNRCPFCNKDLSYLDNYIFRAQLIAYKHFQSDHLMAQNLLKKAKEINSCWLGIRKQEKTMKNKM